MSSNNSGKKRKILLKIIIKLKKLLLIIFKKLLKELLLLKLIIKIVPRISYRNFFPSTLNNGSLISYRNIFLSTLDNGPFYLRIINEYEWIWKYLNNLGRDFSAKLLGFTYTRFFNSSLFRCFLQTYALHRIKFANKTLPPPPHPPSPTSL